MNIGHYCFIHQDVHHLIQSLPLNAVGAGCHIWNVGDGGVLTLVPGLDESPLHLDQVNVLSDELQSVGLLINKSDLLRSRLYGI